MYIINICDFSNAVLNFLNNSEMLFWFLRDNFIQKRLQFFSQQQRQGLSSSEDVISIMFKMKRKPNLVRIQDRSKDISRYLCKIQIAFFKLLNSVGFVLKHPIYRVLVIRLLVVWLYMQCIVFIIYTILIYFYLRILVKSKPAILLTPIILSICNII